MAFIGSDNALAWAHFRLKGGWRRSVSVAAGALVLMGGGVIFSGRADPVSAQQTYFGWTLAMLVLNAATLVLYVPGRLSNIGRQDMASKMIESHRLMPMGSFSAVAGYIAGAAVQPLVLCSAVFFIGSFAASAAQVDFERWAAANAVLGSFAVFIWVLTSFAAFSTKGAGFLVFFPMIVPWMSEGGSLGVLPGLTVLLSPIFGRSVFDLRSTFTTIPSTYAIAFAAQAFFGAICFIGAARRFRDAEAVGLTPALGLAMLLGWAGVSCAGIHNWDDFSPRGWTHTDTQIVVQIVASITASLLLALSPLSSAAWSAVRWRRHEALRDPRPMTAPMPGLVVIAVALLAVLLLPLAPPVGAWAPAFGPTTDMMVRTAVIALVFAGGMYCLFEWVYSATRSAAAIAFIWLLVTWTVPLAIDFVRYGLSELGDVQAIGGIASCSPIGALVCIWDPDHQHVNTTAGIVFQALLNAIPLALLLFDRWKQRSKQPQAGAALAAGDSAADPRAG
jgi:hypothetical protein